jgi:L-alanine-DL-glutamate epimerase-like enolase superfamily enzyme
MKITDVRVHVLEPFAEKFHFKYEWEPMTVERVFIRIETDTGHEGHCITWLLSPAEMVAKLPGFARKLIGRDPHDVEAISYELTDRLRVPTPAASAIDIALWDVLGKYHEEPIYRLLGAARDRIRAYASTVMYPQDQDWVDLALECRDQGFNAYKLHPYGIPEKDIPLARKVRDAVGDTMDLMFDPVNAYDRRGAFKVAAVLEELDYYWFEAPIADQDLQGLTDLTRSFRIQITATESIDKGLLAYPAYLKDHVVDGIRSVGDWIGGISAMKKTAGLCEAFGVKYEPHSYGTTLVQAAHLHVMLATHNCDFVEIPVPLGIMDEGMVDVIRPGADGFVDAPTKPGLGYDVDWDEIERLTVREVSGAETLAAA